LAAKLNTRGILACLLLLAVGLVFEVLWISISALSAWVTEVPAYTAALTAGQGVPWTWLHAAIEARLGPDQTGLAQSPPVASARQAFVLGLTLAGCVYLLMLVVLKRSNLRGLPGVAIVFGLALLFDATVCSMPGLLSGDVILYATFGRLAGVHQIDPYLVSNAWSQFAQTDATWWWYVPTPYGPFWSDLSALLARLTADLGPIPEVLTFRWLAAVAFAANLGLVWWLTPRLVPTLGQEGNGGEIPHAPTRVAQYYANATNDRLLAVALLGWNPLVLFETGQGHNDTFIATLLLLSLVPLVAHRRSWDSHAPGQGNWLVTFSLVVLATLVKYLAVVVGVFLALVRLRQIDSLGGRLRAMVVLAALAVGLTALTLVPFRDSAAVLQTMLNATAGGQRYANSIVDLPTFSIVARYLDKYSEHIPQSMAQVRFWQQLVVRTLMAAYVCWEIRRIWVRPKQETVVDLRMALDTSVRVSLLLVIFVLTQTLDYYFISPLALGVLLGWRNTWTQIAVAISVLFLPTFYFRRMSLEPAPDVFLLIALALPLVIGVVAGLGGRFEAIWGVRAGKIGRVESASRR
jgi:hypothetical protein